MQDQNALAVFALYRDEAHGWAGDCLADRFSVRHVILAAFDIGLHISGRHQFNLMPERGDLTCPVVSGCTSFHPNQAGWQFFECIEHRTSAYLLPDHDAACFINAVKLENRFSKIDPDCGNGHGGRLLICWHTDSANMAHCDAGRRSRPPHQSNPNRSPASFGVGAFIQPEAGAIRIGRCFSSI